MASTAAWSAASLSPRPISRAAASAAASVTRTSSSARLRSGFVDSLRPMARRLPFRAMEAPLFRQLMPPGEKTDALGYVDELQLEPKQHDRPYVIANFVVS